VEQEPQRRDDRASSEETADFQPPRLTALGRVNDLTRDFVSPGSGDFLSTGSIS
jgi:hypothetical protein